MKTLMEKLERLLELGGTKKDIALLAIGGIALVCSLLKRQPLPLIWRGSQSYCAACRSYWRQSSGW